MVRLLQGVASDIDFGTTQQVHHRCDEEFECRRFREDVALFLCR